MITACAQLSLDFVEVSLGRIDPVPHPSVIPDLDPESRTNTALSHAPGISARPLTVSLPALSLAKESNHTPKSSQASSNSRRYVQCGLLYRISSSTEPASRSSPDTHSRTVS